MSEMTYAEWQRERTTVMEEARVRADTIAALRAEVERLRRALSVQNDEICQTLGKALGYPWFKDDQVNFPGATEANGICPGEHVAESMAMEAARELAAKEVEIARLLEHAQEGKIVVRALLHDLHECDWPLDETWNRARTFVGQPPLATLPDPGKPISVLEAAALKEPPHAE